MKRTSEPSSSLSRSRAATLAFCFFAFSFLFLTFSSTLRPSSFSLPAFCSTASQPNRRPMRSKICCTFVLKWFLWSCDQPRRAGTSSLNCGRTMDTGSVITESLMKPIADLTISRFEEVRKTMTVERSSDCMVVGRTSTGVVSRIQDCDAASEDIEHTFELEEKAGDGGDSSTDHMRGRAYKTSSHHGHILFHASIDCAHTILVRSMQKKLIDRQFLP